MRSQTATRPTDRDAVPSEEITFLSDSSETEESDTMTNMLIERLGRIEEKLQLLLQQRIVQKFYSTADVAKLLGKAEFTVREWCRHHRIRAEKRPCGRGHSLEWMISHEELDRLKAEGLLRPED